MPVGDRALMAWLDHSSRSSVEGRPQAQWGSLVVGDDDTPLARYHNRFRTCLLAEYEQNTMHTYTHAHSC